MISLITDFGNDPYVGIMKGVILGIHPDARIVDITHHIQPQAIEEAAFILRSAYSYFPERTVHCVVVDPGVGSDRSILIVRTKTATFLAPDNGVLSFILEEEKNPQLFKVSNASVYLKKVSHTFHGRDIFAPIAAHLDRGLSPEALGIPVENYQKLNSPKPTVTKNIIRGHILLFDHFGNAITNIPASMLQMTSILKIKTNNLLLHEIHKTYADAANKFPLALVGSHNHLEIAVKNGNAREQLDLEKGQIIEIELLKDNHDKPSDANTR